MSLHLLDNEKRESIEKRIERFENIRFVNVIISVFSFSMLFLYIMPVVGENIMPFLPIHLFFAIAITIALMLSYHYVKTIWKKENETDIILFHTERDFEMLGDDITLINELVEKHKMLQHSIKNAEQAIAGKKHDLIKIMGIDEANHG